MDVIVDSKGIQQDAGLKPSYATPDNAHFQRDAIGGRRSRVVGICGGANEMTEKSGSRFVQSFLGCWVCDLTIFWVRPTDVVLPWKGNSSELR